MSGQDPGWGGELLRRGYVVWHCYACGFKSSTAAFAYAHLEQHDHPNRSKGFAPPSEPTEYPEMQP